MKYQAVLFPLILCTTIVFLQRVKVTVGDFKNLKGTTAYNLEFDYSNLSIPKYESEKEFLEDKMAKRDEKDPGSGEKFKESWFADRPNRYEPKFIESFNKRFEDSEIKVGKDIGAAYTMKIHTTMMYAGYNVGVIRQNSKIEATRAFGMDYDSGYRIAEAYAKLAKEIAANIKKKTK